MPIACLRFLGAAGNVTGSRFIVEAAGIRLLVDAGLYQEREFADRNWDPLPVDPRTIDAVLLTHAHLDHSGYLPKLVKDGFFGPIYCTAATADITTILLEDSARIQQEDADFKRRRHQREGRTGPRPEVPLYTVDDAQRVPGQFQTVDYGDTIRLGNNVTAVFRNAGHILGSGTVLITVPAGNETRSILFSGDLGRAEKPLMDDPETYEHADFAVIESTYGDRLHSTAGDAGEHVARIVSETIAAGGNVLIPSFAVERAQELLFQFKRLFQQRRLPEVPVFVDSPMATDVTRVFERHPELLDPDLAAMLDSGDSPFRFPSLTMVRSVDESKAINNRTQPSIIIAGAGMCNGGRIKHHLVNNIERPESTVLFVGYQAHGTLGRQIVDGNEQVRILGNKYRVRARIERMDSFSAHADRDGLTNWLRALRTPPKTVFAVHGEESVIKVFATHITSEIGSPAIAPAYGESFTLDG